MSAPAFGGLRVEKHPYLPRGTMMVMRGKEPVYMGPIAPRHLADLGSDARVCLSPADYDELLSYTGRVPYG